MLCRPLSNHQAGQAVKYHTVTAIVLGVLVAGCNRKAEGQTVAVVNGDEITVPDLNFALSTTKVPDGADEKDVRSQVLQQLVDRRLLAEQAQKEGIDKSPDYLNRKRRTDEDLLISMLADRRLKSAQLPSDRDIQTYMAAHPEAFAGRETWGLDQISYLTPTDKGILGEIAATHSIDALIGVLQKHNITFNRQKNRLDTSAMPVEIYTKLNTLPAGEPFVVPFGNRSVASSITAREPHPVAGDAAKPVAVETIRKTQTAKSLEGLLKSLRSSSKIEYQPGYAPPATPKS